MLDIKFIRDNKELVKKALQNKRVSVDIDKLLELDNQRRELIAKSESVRAEQKKTQNRERGAKLKDEFKRAEEQLSETYSNYNWLLYQIPNVSLADVPDGNSEEDNVILKVVGDIPNFDFTPKDHLELGVDLDIIDTERATKISGSRFAYLKNEAVLLEFALTQFALETLREEGFQPIIPPVLLRQSITEKLGYWHAGGNENYYLVYDPVCIYCNQNLGAKRLEEAGLLSKVIDNLEKEKRILFTADGTKENMISKWVTENQDLSRILDVCPRCNKSISPEVLYLAGTAEHSVVPMFKDEILDVETLPSRFIAFSTCFRREAGTYGKDTKGILRVHQFDKLEMVSFVGKDDDIKEHDLLLSLQEKLFGGLGIPYRVLKLCAGDMSFPAARQYDLEAWIPSQNMYREVTSTSTTTDFQARRLNIRYKHDKETDFVHILNGTAFAIGRTIIAILENYQTKDGGIMIPKVLQKYMGIKEIKKK